MTAKRTSPSTSRTGAFPGFWRRRHWVDLLHPPRPTVASAAGDAQSVGCIWNTRVIDGPYRISSRPVLSGPVQSFVLMLGWGLIKQGKPVA